MDVCILWVVVVFVMQVSIPPAVQVAGKSECVKVIMFDVPMQVFCI